MARICWQIELGPERELRDGAEVSGMSQKFREVSGMWKSVKRADLRRG